MMISGPAGTAEPLLDNGPSTCLASWLIHAPGQSPAWSHYLLSVIHLRPVVGTKPAAIRVPGSSHELLLVALDPQVPPKVNDNSSLHYLTPANAEVQFLVGSDELAVELGFKCVIAICDGVMPAEPPVSMWKGWDECVVATAEHMRTGGYHE